MVRMRVLIGIALLLLVSVAALATPRLDEKVVLINNRPMIALRDFAEIFDATVDYNVERDEISIALDDTTVYVVPYRMTAWVNERKVWLDMPVVIVDDVTYLPVGFLCDAFRLHSEWVPDSRQVVIIWTTDRIVLEIDRDWCRRPHVWRHDYDYHWYIHFHQHHRDGDRDDDRDQCYDGHPPYDGGDHHYEDSPRHDGGGHPGEARHDGSGKPDGGRPHSSIDGPGASQPGVIVTPGGEKPHGPIDRPDVPYKPTGERPPVIVERPGDSPHGGIGKPDAPTTPDAPGTPGAPGKPTSHWPPITIGRPDAPRHGGAGKPDGFPYGMMWKPERPPRGTVGNPAGGWPHGDFPRQEASIRPWERNRPPAAGPVERGRDERGSTVQARNGSERKETRQDDRNTDRKDRGSDSGKGDKNDR